MKYYDDYIELYLTEDNDDIEVDELLERLKEEFYVY